jgi:hypothetical protein
MIIPEPDKKKELDEIPDVDENGDPIYKIDNEDPSDKTNEASPTDETTITGDKNRFKDTEQDLKDEGSQD